MKFNPDIIEREEGSDLVLFNPKNRMTLLLTGEKVREYRHFKCSLPHSLTAEDLELLIQYGVVSQTRDFTLRIERGLKSKLRDSEALYRRYTKDYYPHRSPLGVLWSITQRCNLKCPYCHAEASSIAYTQLTYTELVTIADKLISAGVFEIVLNGGEPFLRSDLFDLLRYLRKSKVLLSVNTNGTLIDQLKAKRLADLSMIVGISLDGPNEEINSLTRGKGVFDRVIRAIQILRAHGVATHVLTTITRLNFPVIDAIVRLVSSVGVEVITLQDLHPAGFGKQVYRFLSLTPEQERSILQVIRQLAEDFPNMTINTTELSYFAYHEIACQHAPSHRTPLTLLKCTACTETLYIDAEGEMYPCVALTDFPMGNLLTDDFQDCWDNSLATHTIRSLSRLPVTTIELCKDCSFNYICMGGCRGDAIAVFEDYLAPHPRCPVYLNDRETAGSKDILNGESK